MSKISFVSMEMFEASINKKENRTTSTRGGKRNDIREFLSNPDNVGKPAVIPNEWLICAKSPEGFTKDTTDEKLKWVRHAFNAAIESLNRDEFGGKIRKKVVFNKETAQCYVLIEDNGKVLGHEVNRQTVEQTEEAGPVVPETQA